MKPHSIRERKRGDITYSLIDNGTGELFYVARGVLDGEMIEPMMDCEFKHASMYSWIQHVKTFRIIDKFYEDAVNGL